MDKLDKPLAYACKHCLAEGCGCLCHEIPAIEEAVLVEATIATATVIPIWACVKRGKPYMAHIRPSGSLVCTECGHEFRGAK